MDIKAAVIINSSAIEYNDFEKYILPTFKVFGLQYIVIDLTSCGKNFELREYPLVIIGHQNTFNTENSNSLFNNINTWYDFIKGGGGLVSFDKNFHLVKELGNLSDAYTECTSFKVADYPHYITYAHYLGEKIELQTHVNPYAHANIQTLSNLKDDVKVLIYAGETPYLMTKEIGQGKYVQWIGYEWLDEHVRGYLWGMDDLLWRSFVWAARKPFLLRDIPNFATLRVDDCVGDHGYYKKQPFLWVDIANNYGFKPWLGFFHEDISIQSVKKMKDLIYEGKSTAQFHGVYIFGKIYKYGGCSEEISRLIDNWFDKFGEKFPLSKYFIPHAYDLSTECVSIVKKLGAEIIGMPYKINSCGGAKDKDNPWLNAAPYRLVCEGSDGIPWSGVPENRPIYYADWYHEENTDITFFNLLSEIRNVNGYEWFNYSADNFQYEDIASSIRKGTEILKRCYDSKILGNLFTHEDSWRGKFISKICPENWERIIAGVSSNIARFSPVYTTMDEAVLYVRDLHTSMLKNGKYEFQDNSLSLTFNGKTMKDTYISVFEEKNNVIFENSYKIFSFEGTKQIKVNLIQLDTPIKNTIFDKEFPILDGSSSNPLMLGTRFFTLTSGSIGKIRMFTVLGDKGVHKVSIWNMKDKVCLVDNMEWIIDNDFIGWQEIELPVPIKVAGGQEIIVGVSTCVESKENYSFASLPCCFYFPISKLYFYCNRGSGVMTSSLDEMPLFSDDNFSCYFRDILFKPESV